MTSSLLAFADAQVTLLLLVPALKANSLKPGRGLARPLILSYGVVNPGLAHPPPLLGDGDRDKDIKEGVPGMVGNGWAKPFAGSPDEAPGCCFDDCGSCRFNVGLGLVTDDARRRRCDPIETCVEAGEARLEISRMSRRIVMREVKDGLLVGETIGFDLIGVNERSGF